MGMNFSKRSKVVIFQWAWPLFASQKVNMSSFDKTLETLAPQDARKWQEFKNIDWKK